MHCLIVCSVEYMYNEVFFLVLSVFAHTIVRSHVAQYHKRFQQHTSVRIHVRNLPFYKDSSRYAVVAFTHDTLIYGYMYTAFVSFYFLYFVHNIKTR